MLFPDKKIEGPFTAGTLEKKQNFFSNHRRETPAAAAKRPERLLHGQRKTGSARPAVIIAV